MATEHKAFDKATMAYFWGKVKTCVANAISGLYTKPSGGIPKSDLSSEVQTSLGKADSALQEHQDISGKQDVISDLSTIRSGAALGATALQSFTETDPTVPAWAKQSTKPSYSASEVGALPSSTTYAGSPSAGGVANKTASIPYGETNSSSTASAYTATIDGITELRDGVCCILRNTARTSTSGFTLNINNLGAKPLYSANKQNSQETYGFLVNNTYLLVYNTALGGWIMGKLSDENVDESACYLFNYTGIKTKTLIGRFMFCVTYDEEYVLPVNSYDGNKTTSKVLTTESFDIFGQVYYYNVSYANAADKRVGGLFYARAIADLQYAFNILSELTLWKKVYLVCVPQSDGRVKLHSNPLSQSLPTTEDGLVYKLLGHVINDNQICLYAHKPCYYYKDGKLRLWTGG